MTPPSDRASPSLRARLTALLLLAVLITALVQAAITWRTALAETEAVFDAQMERVALSLTGGLAASVLGDDALGRGRGAEELIVQIWRADGIMLYRSPSAQLLPPQTVIGFSNVRAGGQDWRVYALETPIQVIQIAQAERARRRMAGQLALRAVLPVALLAPVLMLIVWWVVGRALAPIARLRRQLAARGAGDLAPLPTDGLPAEVRPLVEEMNGLLARLAAAWQQLADFTADAAHELRSPLAALRLQVQGLQRAGSEAERAQATGRLLAGVDRATRLVEQLLALARHDGAARGTPAPVDLAALARHAVHDAAAEARARGIVLAATGDPVLTVTGQSEALAVLLRNLVDNALRHAPDGGQVRVLVRRLPGGAAELAVDDSGPGIAPGERQRVLDRFYRVPGTAGHGSGLGLAIVQAVARRHGAQVVVESSPTLGGARVAVRWPVGALRQR
ncbi:MAG TPA: ATP-binding protein [Ottowia sp.]|uniref:ATP-binding protein n=1 Tax=Ottowia sp. TaxID=1898956 RepID=UPI002B53BB56|nr:ATP-binding protein [Ottowia sp.]HMN22684.1 ATP-binding protein [Ottowia sp.]